MQGDASFGEDVRKLIAIESIYVIHRYEETSCAYGDNYQ